METCCDLTLLSFLFLPQIVNLTVTNDVPLKYQTTAWERFPRMEASFHTHSNVNLLLNLDAAAVSSLPLCFVELVSPGAESDVVMVEGCLDDHDVDRGGGLLDDMDEALTSEGGLMLEAGPSDLCDMHDPDLDESNRAIR